MDDENDDETRESIKKLSRDLHDAATNLGPREARFLVDGYYLIQENRIRCDAQLREMAKEREPNQLLSWLSNQSHLLEKEIFKALDTYSSSDPLGVWAKSLVGIGPVLSAGLLAHINTTETQVVGRIWRYAGLDASVKWEKGKKRPWNAQLKVICWKIGESFVKQQNHKGPDGKPDCLYGQFFAKRKPREIEMNDRGDYKEQALEKLRTTNIKTSSEAYQWYSGKWAQNPKMTLAGVSFNPELKDHVDALSEMKGITKKAALEEVLVTNPRPLFPKLPPAHVQSRAKRVAVKLFLSHYFEVACRLEGRVPPKPFPFSILDHDPNHYIEPPSWPMAA